ncbi:MAG: vWA domain-containing protein [Planctomycetota bacterium]
MKERLIQFCLDISRSMRSGNPPPIDELNGALTKFHGRLADESLPGDTQVGVVQYHGSAIVTLKHQPLQGSYKSMLRVPENAYGSNVFDGVAKSLEQLDAVTHVNAGTSEKYLVLITDGGASKPVPNGSGSKLELRQSWLNELHDLVVSRQKQGTNVVVLGVGEIPEESQNFKNIHMFAGGGNPYLGKDYDSVLDRLFVLVSNPNLSVIDDTETQPDLNKKATVDLFTDDIGLNEEESSVDPDTPSGPDPSDPESDVRKNRGDDPFSTSTSIR